MQQTLRAARDSKGWSLEELAAKSGVHKSTISRLERGETAPMHGTAARIEKALGLKPGTLVFGLEAVSA